MKLHVKALERIIEIPECAPDTAAQSPLRQLLDDVGLEVKGIEVHDARGVVFTIETLANRGDHLYTLGVAREISARTLSQIKLPALASQLPERKTAVPVRRVTELCSRYALLEMAVPEGMELRSDVALYTDEPGKKHPIVDILNFVQNEVGQPMHAFDFDKVEGEIAVELSKGEETIEALDGKSYKVPSGSIVIRDRKKVIAVAGVIGCANSMVTSSTRKVLIEAAVFDPVSVRKTARAMGISTDASYFFERGVDPEGIPFALKRLINLAGGSAGAVGTVDGAHALGYSYSELAAAEKRRVLIPLSVIRAQMNLPRLEEVEILARLKNLGYGVEVTAEGKDKLLSLMVPSWRLWDVTSPEDIIEDITRSFSFSRVKPELPPLDYITPEKNPCEVVLGRVRPELIGQGFVEVISKVFYTGSEASAIEALAPKLKGAHITIKNALEQGNSHLKVTNAIHLGRIISANRKRGVLAPKIYEPGRLFRRPAELPSDEPRERAPLEYNYERDVLCLAAGGRWSDSEFRKGESLEDVVRSFVGVVSLVVRSLGAHPSISKSEDPLFHPGMQGSIKAGRSVVGVVGVLHPSIQEVCDSKEPILYAELDTALLFKAILDPEAPAVSDLPAIRRDITVQIAGNEQSGKVVRYLNDGAFDALTDVVVVDDFKRADESFRRVTYRLKFQKLERTLQHEEVDKTMESIISTLSDKHSIALAP